VWVPSGTHTRQDEAVREVDTLNDELQQLQSAITVTYERCEQEEKGNIEIDERQDELRKQFENIPNWEVSDAPAPGSTAGGGGCTPRSVHARTPHNKKH